MKFSIKIPIYNCTCHVIISSDIEKIINKYIKLKKWDSSWKIEEDCEVHGYTISPGNTRDYYLFYSLESLSVTYLTHEISHIIDAIFSEKGIESEGEARAYLTGFISEKVFDFVLKKRLLINKWYKLDEKPSKLFREDSSTSEGISEKEL